MYDIDTILTDIGTFRQAVLLPSAYHPMYVKIKLIFGCNLRCEMCNHWRSKREAPLPMEKFEEIITELANLGCKKIHFSGGEPLLRPETPDLINHASQLGIRTTLTTNGTRLDKRLAKTLIQNGLRGVNISIDSPERKIHDRIRGMRGAWKKACKAVTYFARYADKGKITIRINTVISRHNYRSLKPLPELAYQLGAHALNLIPVDGHCDESLRLKTAHLREYNQEIAPPLAEKGLEFKLFTDEQQAYPFGISNKELKNSRHGNYAFGYYRSHPCYAPWTHSLIDYNGLVYLCCMTREQTPPLGDLKSQSFRDIWEGEVYQEMRKRMRSASLKNCHLCDDFLVQNQTLHHALNDELI